MTTGTVIETAAVRCLICVPGGELLRGRKCTMTRHATVLVANLANI